MTRTIRCGHRLAGAVFVALMMVVGSPSNAAFRLPVQNGSFEAPTLQEGGFAGTIPDWVLGPGSGLPPAVGTFNPTSTQYSGGATDGRNVAFSKDGFISQTVPIRLQGDTTYTVDVDVGHRRDNATFPGYSVELWAGSRMLASESSLRPAAGAFQTSTFSYRATTNDPSIGQELRIVLDVDPVGDFQVNFDNVRLSLTNKTLEDRKRALEGVGFLLNTISFTLGLFTSAIGNAYDAVSWWVGTAIDVSGNQGFAIAAFAASVFTLLGGVILGATALGSTAFYLGVAGLALSGAGIATAYFEKDPPDSNFHEVARPDDLEIARDGIVEPTILSAIDTANSALKVADLMGVQVASIERYQGALLAGDFDAALTQYNNVAEYDSELAFFLRKLASDLGRLNDAVESSPLGYLSSEELESEFRRLMALGPPESAYALVESVSSAKFPIDLDEALAALRKTDPHFGSPMGDQMREVQRELLQLADVVAPAPSAVPEPQVIMLLVVAIWSAVGTRRFHLDAGRRATVQSSVGSHCG